MLYKYCFVLLALFSTLLANESIDESIITGDEEILFVLPVNWTANPQYNLNVTIPKGFIPLQPFSEWEKATLIEFVPKGEDGDNWSEIISINKFIGDKIAADIFTETLKGQLVSKVQNAHLVESSIKKLPDYTKAKLIFSYDFQDRHEINEVIYFSGPFDCSGVQYTVRTDKKRPEKSAIGKIKAALVLTSQ